MWLPNIDRLRTGIEQFKVDQSGTQVTVTRFDKYSLGKNAFKGWHRDLRFHCCKNEGMFFENLDLRIISKFVDDKTFSFHKYSFLSIFTELLRNGVFMAKNYIKNEILGHLF